MHRTVMERIDDVIVAEVLRLWHRRKELVF